MVQKFSPLWTTCGTGSTRSPMPRSETPVRALVGPASLPCSDAASAAAERFAAFGSAIHPPCSFDAPADSAKGFAVGAFATMGSNDPGVAALLGPAPRRFEASEGRETVVAAVGGPFGVGSGLPGGGRRLADDGLLF